MKLLRPHRPATTLVFLIVGFLLLSGLFQNAMIVDDVYSQSGCPSLSPGSIPPWPEGATVTVYIDPSYETNQIDAIKAAFTNWQNSTGTNGNNSGVTFTYTSTQGSGSYPFAVLKDDAPVAGVRAEVTNFSISQDRLASATVKINPGVTAPGALTKAMAHERCPQRLAGRLRPRGQTS